MAKVRLKTTTRTQRAVTPIAQAPKRSAGGRIVGAIGWLAAVGAIGWLVVVAMESSSVQTQENTALAAAYDTSTKATEAMAAAQQAELQAARQEVAAAREQAAEIQAAQEAEEKAAAEAAKMARLAEASPARAAYDTSPSVYDSPWGRYPDLRLRLERLQVEEQELRTELVAAKADAAVRAKQLNKMKFQMETSSTPYTNRRAEPPTSHRSFKVSVRNTDRERPAPVTIYHIAFGKLSQRKPRFYLMHNHKKTVTIQPQETFVWDVPDLRVHATKGRTGYQGYVVLMYDETGQKLEQYNSNSYFREDAEALRDLPTLTAIDNHGDRLDGLTEEEEELVKFKDEDK